MSSDTTTHGMISAPQPEAVDGGRNACKEPEGPHPQSDRGKPHRRGGKDEGRTPGLRGEWDSDTNPSRDRIKHRKLTMWKARSCSGSPTLFTREFSHLPGQGKADPQNILYARHAPESAVRGRARPLPIAGPIY